MIVYTVEEELAPIPYRNNVITIINTKKIEEKHAPIPYRNNVIRKI